MCQEMNQALLKGIQVSAEVPCGSRVHQPTTGDHADLVTQTADLMRVVAAEKGCDVLVDRQAAEKAPHFALRGRHRSAFWFEIPSSAAISRSCLPESASSTM